MKLVGNLKDKVEKASSKEEARGIISKAGMELTADELNMVVGGGPLPVPEYIDIMFAQDDGNTDMVSNMRDPQIRKPK